MGGCCGPSRLDPSGFIFQDNGSTFEDTSNKITAISNAPMMQTVSVVGSYLKYFIDDHAMVNIKWNACKVNSYINTVVPTPYIELYFAALGYNG